MMRAQTLFLPVLIILMVGAGAAPAGILVEVTFDDADDGAGPMTGQGEVDNLQNDFASLGQGYRPVQLTGTARRSAFGEGRYGRAADLLDGGGSVRIDDWDLSGLDAVTVMTWVRARDVAEGRLFHVEDTVALSLDDGELVLEVWDAAGGATVLPTGVGWPADGGWHHLAFSTARSDGGSRLRIALDFAEAVVVDAALQAPPGGAEISLGESFDGLLDELLIHDGEPTAGDVWDWDPDSCPDGLSCSEEVLALIPEAFSHRVPVRLKAVHDPAQCSETTPCPLLVIISGGGTCANNYSPQERVEYYARDGFVAVTVDLYCEGARGFSVYPMETSQLVAAKNHLMTDGPLAAMIDGPEYAATGCSHGCGTVTTWMMLEDDYPQRTFGNSCSLDWIVCPYAAGLLCPAVAAHVEERILEELGTLDLDHPAAEELYSRGPIAALTPATTASRELAAAWGLSLEGELCRPDGTSSCFEDSLWGMTHSSRRVRDIWQRLEPEEAPTGYFVENHESDCRHCATVGSAAWECGSCLLKHGRAGMAEACPECLSYDDPTIEPGAPALECPLDASWYRDPLTAPIGPGGPGSCPGELSYVVPAGGRLPGALGTLWVTDAAIGNRGARTATVTIFLMERDRDNSTMDSSTIEIPAGESVELRDLFLDRFNREEVAGALWICADQPLHVVSRTFNDAASGTYGQGIPGAAADAAIGSGASGWLGMLSEDEVYRANAGFVNTSGRSITVTAELLSASGDLLGSRSYPLPPYGYIQRSRIFTEVGAGSVANGQIVVRTDRGEIFAYASVIDNRTGDPTYIAAQ